MEVLIFLVLVFGLVYWMAKDEPSTEAELRDMFAAEVLEWSLKEFHARIPEDMKATDFYKRSAETAYAIADAMMEARKDNEEDSVLD